MLSKHNIIAFFMSNDTRFVIAQIAMAFYILDFCKEHMTLTIKEDVCASNFVFCGVHGENAVMFIFALKLLKLQKNLSFFILQIEAFDYLF